jgi:poly(A) polymerase
VRGDALAAALALDDGPQLGRLLAEIDEARFAGEIATPEEAVTLAARLLERPEPSRLADR